MRFLGKYLTRCHVFLLFAILCNCLVLLYISHVHIGNTKEDSRANEREKGRFEQYSELESQVTVVILEFEEFENDLPPTIQSIVAVLPRIQIVVISRRRPYPPVDFPAANVQLVIEEVSLDQKQSAGRPESHINTPYVLLVPDGTRFITKDLASAMLQELKSSATENQIKIVAVPLEGQTTQCLGLNVDIKRWTLEYSFSVDGSAGHSKICDVVTSTPVVLLKSAFLHSLGSPYLRPFPQSLFVQSAVFHLKTKLLWRDAFPRGPALFANPHNLWKFQNNMKKRTSDMYKRFGIKKVVNPTRTVDWYGCNKDTPRCFGTVVDDMPAYIYESKWTPPCCLQNLQETTKYVFEVLEKSAVKYWLEGGSLLGAARHGNVIPWDYDTDIGIYKKDIGKCEFLVKAEEASKTGSNFVDSFGYVWEKAREGEFFRVQYSQSNHMHVDIFPFYEKDGVMTKDTWFKTHRQDTEFPSHFLNPLSTISFMGIEASAPNNVRKFLEFKFGAGVIENPQYPNPAKLRQKSKVNARTGKMPAI